MADANTQAGQTGSRTDPYRAYNFKLEIQGVTEGHFAECSGLDVKVHSISYREGGNAQVVRKLPGPVEYGDITLRYGLTESRELWDWFTTSVQGKVDRRNVSIVMLDSDGVTEVMRWNLISAWPSQWRGAPLNALDKEVAIETMTLVFETLERA
ncbi:MAG: phage tail protein [Betaproteobacteria bacterium]